MGDIDDSAVKNNGSADDPTASSATATNATPSENAIDKAKEPALSHVVNDSDFDDLDEANQEAIKGTSSEDSEETEQDTNKEKTEDKTEEGESDNKDKADEGDKDSDKQPDDAAKSHSKEARETQLKEEIAKLRDEMGIKPNEDIRNLVEERNRLREMAELSNRSLEANLEQRYLDMINPDTDDYYTPDEARALARSATLTAVSDESTMQAWKIGTEHNQTVIRRETNQALEEWPMFNKTLPDGKENPNYNAEAAELAGEMLQDSFVFQTDPETQKQVLVNIKRSPYQIFKKVAEFIDRNKSASEANARDAATRQEASADIPVSSNTNATNTEAALKDFDDAWDAYGA